MKALLNVVPKSGALSARWKEMEEVKKLGLTKSIGVSNFRTEDLEVVLADCTIVPAVNQVCSIAFGA